MLCMLDLIGMTLHIWTLIFVYYFLIKFEKKKLRWFLELVLIIRHLQIIQSHITFSIYKHSWKYTMVLSWKSSHVYFNFSLVKKFKAWLFGILQNCIAPFANHYIKLLNLKHVSIILLFLQMIFGLYLLFHIFNVQHFDFMDKDIFGLNLVNHHLTLHCMRPATEC